MSRPSSSAWPPTILPGGEGISFMTDRQETDLPQPDSPTSPRVSPWRSSKEMPSTALTIPSSVLK